MPKNAVNQAFFTKKINPLTCEPKDFYEIATWFGVGYKTLIFHMQNVLHLIGRDREQELSRIRVPLIRATIIGRECRENLVVASEFWRGRAIDAQVTDLLLLPFGVTIEGSCLEFVEQTYEGVLAVAKRPGIGRVALPASTWSNYVRVSRKEYEGLSRYRFEEEVDEDAV